MLQNYFKIAWRNITRHKVFTIINVAGLALGICACIVIFLVSTYEFSFDTFHPDKERIYRVGSKIKEMDLSEGDVPPAALAAFRTEMTGIETVTGYFPYYKPKVTIPGAVRADRDGGARKDADETTRSFDGGSNNVIIADQEYFSVFKYQWLAGNPSGAMNEPFKLVLSENRARKYFGPIPLSSMIGKEVVYDDSLRVTVSGIVKDWPGNTDFPYTDFITFNTIPNSFLKKSRHMDAWGLAKGFDQDLWPVSFVKLSSREKSFTGQQSIEGFD